MDPYRPLDQDALTLGGQLLSETHCALATLLDDTPFVSRAAVLWIDTVGLTLLLSDLSEHARALRQDPKASVMLGQALGRGDPLTHPRLTLVGEAVEIDKAAQARTWRRDRPKTALYFDFGDFRLWQLRPSHGVLNAGFGKAYRLGADDITLARHSAP